MEISEFQNIMKERFMEEAKKRGKLFAISLLLEEAGELSWGVLHKSEDVIKREIADCMFVLIMIANLYEIDVNSAISEYYVERNVDEVIGRWLT